MVSQSHKWEASPPFLERHGGSHMHQQTIGWWILTSPEPRDGFCHRTTPNWNKKRQGQKSLKVTKKSHLPWKNQRDEPLFLMVNWWLVRIPLRPLWITPRSLWITRKSVIVRWAKQRLDDSAMVIWVTNSTVVGWLWTEIGYLFHCYPL